MTHVTCRLTAKNRDQLRNPALGNRVWATFTFLHLTRRVSVTKMMNRRRRCCVIISSVSFSHYASQLERYKIRNRPSIEDRGQTDRFATPPHALDSAVDADLGCATLHASLCQLAADDIANSQWKRTTTGKQCLPAML